MASLTFVASAPAQWVQRASGTSQTLRGAVFGPGKYIAVGDGGTILTSTNGVVWESQASGTEASLRAVTFGMNRFVAVGERGTILSSENGVSWAIRAFGGPRLNGVAFGNGVFLAVGEGGVVLTSRDAAEWTAADSGVGRSLRGVAFGGHSDGEYKFLLVGAAGTVLSSRDGRRFVNYAEPVSTWVSPWYTPVTTADLEGVIGLAVSGGSPSPGVFLGMGEAGSELWAFQDDMSAIGYESWNQFVSVAPAPRHTWRGGTPAGLQFVLVGDGGAVATRARGVDGYSLGELVSRSTSRDVDLLAAAASPAEVVIVGAVGNILTHSLPFLEASSLAPKPPVIHRQPHSELVNEHGPLRLQVEVAEDSGETSNQWYHFSGGSLTPTLIPGATRTAYTVESAGTADSGSYAVTVSRDGVSVTSHLARVGIYGPVAYRGFSNVSVRGFVDGDQGTLIAGYVAEADGMRTSLVRGVGPGLAAFGVNAPIRDPRLRVFSSGGERLFDNDDWGKNAWATRVIVGTDVWGAFGAFPLAGDSRDAAVRLRQDTGAYTIQLDSADGGNGPGLVEIYGNGLTNLSARGETGPGAAVLIVGFAVSPNMGAVLVRGVGPALARFGVTGSLPNPRLQVFDEQGRLVGENSDWESGDPENQAATRAGAFALPRGSKDAALILTLPSGAYTAQLSGVGVTAGIGLVEVYEMP